MSHIPPNPTNAALLARRQYVVHHRLTIFQGETQRSDLLNPGLTHDSLVLAIKLLIDKGHAIGFTAIRTDHGDDRCLGPHGHSSGYAFDCWPMTTTAPHEWLDQNTHDFRQFVADLAQVATKIGLSPDLYKIDAVRQAASKTECFEDDGGPHLHAQFV